MNMETQVYTQKGEKKRTLTLPEVVFGLPFNPNLVHEVVVAMQSNARAGTAHTKDRSEVAGTGKKPWRQKGTGRARHGSRRSPIWTGGGVTFGPRNEKDFSKKINKKAKSKALASVLSKKYSDEEVVLVEKLDFSEPKTQTAKDIMANIAKVTELPQISDKKSNAALIVLGSRDEAVEKSFRNFSNLAVVQAKDVNLLEILTYKYLIISEPDAVLETLSARISNNV